MRPTLILLIWSLALFIKSGQSEKDNVTSFLVKLAIETTLNEVKKTGYLVLLKDFSLTIPAILNRTIVGRFDIKNLTLYGLSTLKYHDLVNVDKTTDGNGTVKTYNVNINATLDKIGLRTTYESDIGILGSVPIYGRGKIQLEVKDIDTKVNVTINDKNGLKIQDLDLELSFTSSNGSYITGFWNNFRVSRFLSRTLNIIVKCVEIFYKLNKMCLECIISRIVRFVANIILIGKDVKYKRCSCSETILPVEQFEHLLESWPDKTVTEIVYDELGNPDKLHQILKAVKNILEEILKYRDNLMKLFQQ